MQPVAEARRLSTPGLSLDLTSFLEICVCDYGIGISAEHLEGIARALLPRGYLFDTRGEWPGSGLALCEHLVALHHGRFWAESCAAGGNTFYLWLPTAEARPLF